MALACLLFTSCNQTIVVHEAVLIEDAAEKGDFIDLKGKGLFAGTGRGEGKYAGMGMHSIRICCWFKKLQFSTNQYDVVPL